MEGKLFGIKESIENLKLTENFSQSTKPNLITSDLRQEYYENERKKTEAVSKQLRKYQKQQKNLEEVIRKHLRKMEKQVKLQKEEEHYNAQYEIFLRNNRIKEEREKMKEKKQKRLEDQENLKKSQSQASVYLSQKPLFQKFQEKFKSDFLMPELERRKEELKRKRELFMPLASERFKEHNLWYENQKKTNKQKFEEMMEARIKEQKTREGALDSTWAAKVIEEKRQFKEKQMRTLQEKQMMLEKRFNYAELVQEMYSPVLDLQKSPKNKEKNKEKLKQVKSDGEPDSVLNWKPKKFKPNSCKPPSKPVKLAIVTDYLAQKRLQRSDPNNRSQETQDFTNPNIDKNLSSDDLVSLNKHAMKLEELARKKSLLLSNTPNSGLALNGSDEVNDLLIGSIKCKLKVLQGLE